MLPTGFARCLRPPYYAVIFTSKLRSAAKGYDDMAQKIEQLAAQQQGYLGIESARGADGIGITVSYWTSLESISAWKENVDHKLAQERGRRDWYDAYAVRIATVERAYSVAPHEPLVPVMPV